VAVVSLFSIVVTLSSLAQQCLRTIRYAGCGILAVYSMISFSANAIFEENKANAFGGAVVTSSSTMNFDSSA